MSTNCSKKCPLEHLTSIVILKWKSSPKSPSKIRVLVASGQSQISLESQVFWSNLSGQAFPANFSSFKEIINRVQLLFPKLLRKAPKSLRRRRDFRNEKTADTTDGIPVAVLADYQGFDRDGTGTSFVNLIANFIKLRRSS